MTALEFTPRKSIATLPLPREKAVATDDGTDISSLKVDTKGAKVDTFEKSSSPANSKEKQPNWLPLALGIVGAITVGGILGTILYYNKKKTPLPSPASVVLPNTVSPNPPTPPAGTPIKRTMQQVKALCNQVMVPSNGGTMGCQTMAFFNSLRLYQKLAKTEAGFDKGGHLPKINQILGNHSPEGLMKKAFEFCRKLPNTEALSRVIDHVESPTTVAVDPLESTLTKIIPHFLSQYSFGKKEFSLSTSGRIDQKEMAKMLQGLCDGKIGLLGCDGVAGGHMISLVGIHEIEKDALSKIITKLKNKEGSTLDANLLSNVRLLIYDQQRAEQKQEAFGELPLLTLFQSTTPQQFYNIRLFSQEKPLNYRYESLFKSVKFSPKGFTSPAYHQELMKAGDAVFTST